MELIMELMISALGVEMAWYIVMDGYGSIISNDPSQLTQFPFCLVKSQLFLSQIKSQLTAAKAWWWWRKWWSNWRTKAAFWWFTSNGTSSYGLPSSVSLSIFKHGWLWWSHVQTSFPLHPFSSGPTFNRQFFRGWFLVNHINHPKKINVAAYKSDISP